jgi:hypothetical protein
MNLTLGNSKLLAFSPLTRLRPTGYGGQALALSPLRPLRGEGVARAYDWDLHFRFERSPVDDLLDHGSQDDIPVLYAGMIALQINGAGP